ncbi:MAG TPA: hypothetical protein VMZ28_08520 [Kofleriaceae bacterium]|nr:hypothetical protein [Kofleriaceae bacterium]
MSALLSFVRASRLAVVLVCAAAIVTVAPGSATAQKKKKKKKDKEKEAAAEAAQPAEPEKPPIPPEAIEEFKKGQEADKAGDVDGALAHYETAFTTYPDPTLQLLIGEAHRKKGTAAMEGEGYEQAITEFEAANAAFNKYIELAPEGAEVENAKKRIEILTQGIKNANDAIAKQKADEQKQQEQDAAATKKADEDRRLAIEAEEGGRFALDGLVVAGVDQDTSAVARLMPGVLLQFGRFALEGHLSFEAFLRTQGDKGVSGRSVSAELGARYGFQSARFTGLFASAGAGFGFFNGKPRERKLVDDMATCEGFDAAEEGACAFDVDRNISTRVGLGWGFEASKKTTVALRLDAMMWFFSVDGEQPTVPAGAVDKPQRSMAVVLGLEFLHWP